MPPLRIFGRKWNIATDDFVYLSFLELLMQFSLILTYLFFGSSFQIFIKCSINLIYQISHIGLGLIIICNVIVNLLLMKLSANGCIMEEIKRRNVPKCIYIKLVFLFDEILLTIPCFTLRFTIKSPFLDCSEKLHVLYLIIFSSLVSLLVIYLLLFYIHFDKLGSKKKMAENLLQNFYLQKQKNIWRNRLKCLLCFYKPNSDENKALDSASNILVAFNKDLSIVLSDYIAGIQLLCLQDAKMDDLEKFSLIVDQSLKSSSDTGKNKIQFRITSKITSGLINDPNSFPTEPSNMLDYGSKYSEENKENANDNESVLFENSKLKEDSFDPVNESYCYENQNKSDWRDLRVIYYFATMAKASYGWPLHLLFRDNNKSSFKVCLGLCCSHSSSCVCSKCICCNYESCGSDDHIIVYSNSNFCNCHKKAILNETLLKEEDLVCVSFYNKVYHSPFFVAIYHEMQVIIVSIRGTFSMNDVLTDMDANFAEFEESHLSGCSAHCGITKAALNIKDILTKENVLSVLMNKNKNYRVIFTGHSLGAGIAIVLSCLYHVEYQNLKCYAFGPPLGTVNLKMADYCKEFVLTIVNGYEWVPRISLQTLTVWENRLINCLNNYPHPKCYLTIQKFLPCKCNCCNETDGKWNILNSYQRDQEFWKDIEMNTKLPGQVIHITNIKSISVPNKEHLPRSEKCYYEPVITSSDQFNAILFHPKMFKDHLPDKIVNRLYRILKLNQLFLPVCHHFIDHYWADSCSENMIILPDLKILNQTTISISTGCMLKDNCFQFSKCIHRNDLLSTKQTINDNLNSYVITYKIASRVTVL